MKTLKFVDEVYGTNFMLISDCAPEAFTALMQTHDLDYEHDPDLKGYCWSKTIGGVFTVILYVKNGSEVATLAHEVFHAVEDSMDYHGITHSEAASEAWAYYLDFVMRKCLEGLR